MTDPLALRAASRETPDALALVAGDLQLTYGQLGARVSERAASLPHGELRFVRPTLDENTMVELLAAIDARCPLVLLHPRTTDAEDRARRALLADLRIPPDTLALLFTSGTTGVPKVAVLPRASMAAALRASAARLGWLPEDRWGLLLPPAHVGGLSVLLRCVQGRATTVLGAMPFEPEEAIALAERERLTLLSLVPTMLARMLDAGWTEPAHLRAVLIGGAALSPALRERALAQRIPIRPTYGMTETCAQLATATEADEPGVGRPLPGVEVAIRGGEILVRGPSLFGGYLGQSSPFDGDGFFATGDAGFLDDAGRLHVRGRLDDRIITGGENVDPLEVESVLEAHPAIDEAAVFGTPDATWGEVVSALVVATADDATLRAALTAALARLAPHRRPRRVFRVQTLPRGGTGKKQRSRCRAAAEALVPWSMEP